jgi:hypothetical protein
MIENFVNLWYQSGKGGTKTKSKGKTQKKTQSTSISTTKSNPKHKAHSKKKYVMDEPNTALMKYPSYKREYECKSQKCNKEWVKMDKCSKNVCHIDKIKQITQDIEKNAVPLNQCIEDNCSKELKNLSQPRGKFNLKKFEKFQNCSTNKCGKESKAFQRNFKKLTNKKNSNKAKYLVKVGTCLTDKCGKHSIKYQTCKTNHCSQKKSNKAKKSKGQYSSKSKTKTTSNHSKKASKKYSPLSSSNITKKTHTKQNFLNISRINA